MVYTIACNSITAVHISKALGIEVAANQINVCNPSLAIEFPTPPENITAISRMLEAHDVDHFYLPQSRKLMIEIHGAWDFVRLIIHVNNLSPNSIYPAAMALKVNDPNGILKKRNVTRFFGTASQKIRCLTRVNEGWQIRFRPSVSADHIAIISSKLNERGVTNHIFPRTGIHIDAPAVKIFERILIRRKLNLGVISNRVKVSSSQAAIACALGVESEHVRMVIFEDGKCYITLAESVQHKMQVMTQKLQKLEMICDWCPCDLIIEGISIERFFAYVKNVNTPVRI